MIDPEGVSDAEVLRILPESGFIRNFVKVTEYTSDAPLVFALGAAVSGMAVLCDPDIMLRMGAKIYPIYWGMLTGGSGTRKSTVVANLTDILSEALPEKVGADHESRLSLIDAVAAQPQQLIAFSEFGNFLGATKGTSHKADMRGALTELWDCPERVESVTRRGGTVTIEKPRVSLLVGAAVGMLEDHTTRQDWTGGFLPRFVVFYRRSPQRLFTLPPGAPGGWNYLVDLMRDRGSRVYGPLQGWHPDIYAPYDKWYRSTVIKWQRRLGERGSGAVHRLGVVAMRSALCYAYDCGSAYQAAGAPWQLGVEDVRFGTHVADIHMRGLASLLHYGIVSSPYERKQRDVIRLIPYSGGVSMSGILRSLQPKLPLRTVTQIIKTLLASGEIYQFYAEGEAYWCRGTQSPTGRDLQTGEEHR